MAVRLSSLAARFPDMVTRTRQDGGVHPLLASAGGKARLAGTASRGPLFFFGAERADAAASGAASRAVARGAGVGVHQKAVVNLTAELGGQ